MPRERARLQRFPAGWNKGTEPAFAEMVQISRRFDMDAKKISVISGAALLALTATASAGPMNVARQDVMAPPQTQIEQVAYHYYHHHYYRHYGYHHHPYYRHYAWRHHRYYHRYYGWYPGAAIAGAALGLATLPFAAAAGWPYYGYPYYGYYGPYYYY
jgi:hypothetical protein